MSWAESLAAMNTTVASVFGDGIVASYAGQPVDLILDQSYMAELDYQGTVTVAYLSVGDYATLGMTEGGIITIDGADYAIRETQPDAGGMTMLVLEVA